MKDEEKKTKKSQIAAEIKRLKKLLSLKRSTFVPIELYKIFKFNYT